MTARSLPGRALTIRARRPADVPALAEILLAQQAGSRYPFRDPLPVPVEEFLHADDAVRAWTAELDGRLVGHVCRTGPGAGSPDVEAMNARCAEAHGCDVEELAWVRTLFVAEGVRGHGVGRRLVETVLADILADGLRPCLEVLSAQQSALALYRSTGWEEVDRTRPAWLRDADDEGLEVHVLVLPTIRGRHAVPGIG